MDVLAFGAGVQSTALAIMSILRDDHLLSAAGKPADLIVFSDPGSESAATLKVVDFVRDLADQYGVPFAVARYSGSRKERLADSLAEDDQFSTIPAFTDDGNGGRGRLMRACTRDYKIRPIAQAIRRHLGAKRMSIQVRLWLGISVDEIQRAKPETAISWQERFFPLLEMGWRRSDCTAYLAHIFPDLIVQRSACVFCPFHSDAEWTRIHAEGGADWAHAVEVDESIRDMGGRGGIKSMVYLHRSLEPLADLPFLRNENQGSLWGEECEGVCGL